MHPLDLMSDTTSDSDDMGAMLGDLDGDLEFFDGLFEDLKHSTCSDGLVSAEGAPTTVLPIAGTAPRSDRRRQRWQPTEDPTRPLRTTTVMTTGWKEIATRQRQQRADAEKRNAELRKVLASHVQASWKLLKLTHKAATLAMRLPIASIGPGMPYMGPSADLARIHHDLDALVREADGATQRVSDVVSMDLQVIAHENRILQTGTGTALESTLEVAWVLPFGVDAIVDALAAHTVRLVTKTDDRDATTLFEGAALKVVQAVTQPKLRNGVPLSKHGQLATRIEPAKRDGSRLLVVAARGGLVTQGHVVVTIEADGYVVVSPVPGHDSEALGPLSRIHWCHKFRYQPSPTSTLNHDERAKSVHVMAARAVRKADRQVDKVTQAMENLLLSNGKQS